MGLVLSGAAAPGLAPIELYAACKARGLEGVELVLGPDDDALAVAEAASASGACVVALRVEAVEARSAPKIARASWKLGVPVSAPPEGVRLESLPSLAAVFAQAGGRLLLGHGTVLDEALARVDAIRAAGSPASIGLAWEIRPRVEDLREASATLFAARGHLGLVRLHGGGPEQSVQDGRGVGSIFVDLALSAYAGPIVLCPSRPEEVPRWSRWLTSKRGAGCGSRLDARTVALDVRDVEPRDRLDTILGAYRSLVPGATLTLTVDHDPSCMYHTLHATEPEGAFRFRVLEHGPEVWRAEVTKR